jgi:hypothetical protein
MRYAGYATYPFRLAGKSVGVVIQNKMMSGGPIPSRFGKTLIHP